MSSAPPLPALLANIQDPAARAAIQAIVDHLNVRNGYVGDGSARFIAVSDLPQLSATAAGAVVLKK